MKEVKFVDVSVRDAPQSLWATRITNEMIMPYAARMDEMGFDWIDLEGGAIFDVCVRYLQEDPWERMRLMTERCSRTPLNIWTRGQSLFTFDFFPDDIVDLTIRRMAANGMHRHTFYDTLGDVRNIELAIKATKEIGLYCCAGFAYALSPVHTDEFYAGIATEVVGHGVDAFIIKDASGLLTPDRIRTLVPAIRNAIGPDMPLELHSHCRGGLAELCYLEAVPLGVDVLHTAISPMAGSDSLPPTEYFVQHLGDQGYGIKLNLDDLAEMADYFRALAERYDKPLGVHNRYDPKLYEHQIPGGMISNLHSQLADIGMRDRFEEVLVEAVQVRQDLGYPVVVSPFAQYTVTQSVINVAQGERYKTIPDEIARYAMGYYGKPVGPILPEIIEKSAEHLGMKEPITQRAGELVEPAIPQLKKERGPFKSDDDLLLAAFYQPAVLDELYAVRDAPGRRTDYPLSALTPLKQLMAEVEKRPTLKYVSVKKGDFSFELEGPASEAVAAK
ncbi:MAG: carboxylase [Alphaproteobacteria bacterium]|nr:carboxylase [Alphaproteobacteria bacterium]|tara:strand:+ start:1002 stop:2507 length:1506 start_codon:yes stop_codon:yes gene_type:complete